MPGLLKKSILSFLLFLVLFGSVAPNFLAAKAATTNPASATADETWYNQSFQTWLGKVDGGNPSEIFGERYTSAQVEWVIYGIFAFFINHVAPPGTVGPCINGDVTACVTGIKSYFDSISLQTDSKQNLASLIFADRPLSGVSYFREKIQNFSLVPAAHAQTVGFGFSALNLVQGMWKSFRDIAFGLFVLVAVVFAFLIMFRVKLNPQTVISVQSALPKIVIALILVTFSYAIAGFLIDLMYIVIGFVSLVMAPLIPTNWLMQPTTYNAASLFNLLTIGPIVKQGSTHVAQGILGLIGLYLTPSILLLILLLIIAGLLSTTGIGIIPAIVILVLVIVVLIIDIWIGLKTIWGLFKAFANILLLTIFAPIQLTLGILIPNFGFGQWVRNYLSNLSVFVVTGVLWLFAWIFSTMAWTGAFSSSTSLTLAASNTTANPWPPLLNSGGAANLLFFGVSFVLFTMIPKATELVQAFMSGKPFAYGTAVGEAFGPIRAGWGLTGEPIAKSYQQAVGRNRVIAIQDRIRANTQFSSLPRWLQDIISANPGNE